MPDSSESVGTTATAVAEATQAEPTTAAPVQAPDATGTPTADDFYERLMALPADEILSKHAGLQGKLGSTAQRLAREQAQKEIDAYKTAMAQQQFEQAQAARQAELERLAKDDPDSPLAQKVLAETIASREAAIKEQQWKAMQAEMLGKLETELNQVLNDPDVQALYESGDAETRKALDWRNFPSLNAFVKSVTKTMAKANLQAEADKLAKARMKAEASQKQIEQVQQGGRPDLGLGNSATVGTGPFKRSQIRDMNLAEFKRNEAEIDRQMALGLIIDDISR